MKLIYALIGIALMVTTAAYSQGLGVNLNGIADYSPELPFCNAAKMARCFGSPDVSYDCIYNDKIPVSVSFGMFVYTDVTGTEGTYKISYNGKSDLAGSGKIQNLLYDGTKTTADIVMGAQPMTLKFTNATSPISNIEIIRPSCQLGMLDSALVFLGIKSAPTFNPDFLKLIEPYPTLRFMDWLRTNASPIKTWADRRLPTEQLQTGSRGVALEYVVELANQANKNIYINIPYLADDNYVRTAAKLIKDTLNNNLNIMVEYSNELWNTAQGFTGNQHKDLAVADVKAGAIDLQMGDPLDTNEWYWARRRVGKRTVQISKIFREVFGDAAMGSRVQIVLAGHSADHSKIRAALQYIDKYEGKENVKRHISHIAIAPYFATSNHLIKDSTGKTTGVKPDATIETVLQGCQSSINSNKANWVSRKPWDGKSQDVNHREYADYYGVKLLFYESGHHLSDPIGAPLVKQTKIDPRFKDIYKNYFMEFFTNNPGSSAFQFVDISFWKNGNEFGATYDLKVETPQILALKEVAKAVNNEIPPPEVCEEQNVKIKALQTQVSSLEAGLQAANSDLEKCNSVVSASDKSLSQCLNDKDMLSNTIQKIKDVLK